MKLRPRRALAGVGALATVGALVLGTSGSALATTTSVGWEADANAIGTITFLDSTGAPVTSGTLSAKPFAAYAVASHAGRTGDTIASLYAATPQVGTNPQTWNSDVLSSSTYSPAPSGTPASVSGTGLPFAAGKSTDFSMNDYIAEFQNSLSTAGYQNLYELRIYTSGAGQAADTTQYDRVDISVNTTAGTWQVVYPSATGTYPDASDATTTTLTTNPTSPDRTTNNPESVTLHASVSAATPVSGYTGPIGTVSFFDGTTQVGTTQLVSGTGPYTASVSDSVANASTTLSSHSFTAKFSPYTGTGLTTSQGSTTYQVGQPVPGTSTALSVTPGATAGTSNSYVATVTYPGSAPSCTGTVSFYDNVTTLVAGPVNPKPGVPNEYDGSNTFNTAGSHSITAVFTPTDSSVCGGSTSPASTFTQAPAGACAQTSSNYTVVNGQNVYAQCSDTQYIQADVPSGVLYINTPYTSTSPLNLGTMALNSTGTMFTASHQFGNSTTDASQDILITDTRAGNLPWTGQAQAANLSDGGSDAGSQISGENVGLTGLTLVPVSGNGFDSSSANFTTFANTAASPAKAPADLGTAGLGGAPHDFAQAQHGIGSIGLLGTLTLNAPSSTEPGHFTGTVTFTLVGSLV